MQLTQIIDPRGPFAKARRIELVRFARERNIDGISEDMPKDLIVKRLQAAGVKTISVPPRPLGSMNPREADTSPNSHHYADQRPQGPATEQTVEIDAVDALERDFLQQQQKPQSNVSGLTIIQARQEAKRRGIKFSRKDTLVILREKLGG